MKLKLALALACLHACLSAQICGTVIDAATREPIPFAIIRLDSTQLVTTSARDGSFCLQTNRSGNLIVQMLGFQTNTSRQTPPISGLQIELKAASFVQDQVLVSATRVDERSAIAHTTLSKEEIEKQNFGQDVPFLLASQPSSVASSDNGTGIGYTAIRIRGTDATRINVTVNGAPVNDAESQGVFWVDLPDISSSAENMQVQRGVGTSTNGAGAFGGSINLQTSQLSEKAFSTITLSGGSFNTKRLTASAGTGLLNNHWAFDGRLSRIVSEGYIDRATSSLSSWSMSGGWQNENVLIKALAFSGVEKTYQAWDGVNEDSIRAGNYTYNQLGQYTDSLGNIKYYENETDNYKQDNYQLLFAWRTNDHWFINATLYSTIGKGYYEQFKEDQMLADYGLANIALGNTTITSTDLIRQRWLDNQLFGFVASAQYRSSKRLDVILGGGASQYNGRHFGQVIWAQFLPANTLNDHIYYDNDAIKQDANVYARTTYRINDQLSFFTDLQLRYVTYQFEGFDENLLPAAQEIALLFFNPKAGITYAWNESAEAYAFFGIANKEPNRTDYTESSASSKPSHETLYDTEAGIRIRKTKTRFGANAYFMNYTNQLVVTGKINDVGAYTRENVKQSYRAGIELEFNWQIIKPIQFIATTTLSQNKIRNYTEYIDDYDNGGQKETFFSETDIALSPALTGFAGLEYQLGKHISFMLMERYVGKQFIDNTSSDSRSLNAYALTDLRINYAFHHNQLKSGNIGLQINNLTNTRYSANGYSYGYIYGGEQRFNFLFPQAGINAMLMVQLKF
jgi:iron complex outermembrane recepter protein